MDGSVMIIILLAIGAYLNGYKERKVYLFKTKKIEYMKGPKWRAKRKEVLERDCYCCQTCGANYSLNIHHISYKNMGDEPLEDLVTLCQDCHTSLHRQLGYDYDKTFPFMKMTNTNILKV